MLGVVSPCSLTPHQRTPRHGHKELQKQEFRRSVGPKPLYSLYRLEEGLCRPVSCTYQNFSTHSLKGSGILPTHSLKGTKIMPHEFILRASVNTRSLACECDEVS